MPRMHWLGLCRGVCVTVCASLCVWSRLRTTLQAARNTENALARAVQRCVCVEGASLCVLASLWGCASLCVESFENNTSGSTKCRERTGSGCAEVSGCIVVCGCVHQCVASLCGISVCVVLVWSHYVYVCIITVLITHAALKKRSVNCATQQMKQQSTLNNLKKIWLRLCWKSTRQSPRYVRMCVCMCVCVWVCDWPSLCVCLSVCAVRR